MALSCKAVRRFHGGVATMMVATRLVEQELRQRGFSRMRRWSRGVDTELFRPGRGKVYDLPRPIFLSVGPLAVERNIEAFLVLDLPGSKVVVGDGPQAEEFKRQYPKVRFTGAKVGEDLAAHYADADVFVFPSRSDTFGLVLLEALASGLPVAAYPMPGPLDVIGGAPSAGVLHQDLREAAMAALTLNPEDCRRHAQNYSWAPSAR